MKNLWQSITVATLYLPVSLAQAGEDRFGMGGDPDMEGWYSPGTSVAVLAAIIMLLLVANKNSPLSDWADDHPWGAVLLVVVVPLVIGVLFR